ncbi:ATPase [Hymenobacter coalescens]
MPATQSVPSASAASTATWQRVRQHLEAFKRKFYLSLLVRGGLVAGGLLLTLFVVFNLLEYFLYLPTWVRGGLLFGFLGLTAWAFVRWIWQPLAALTNLRRLLSDEQAAQQVGKLYPEVQDKLLNALQLQGQARDNALIAASLEQRAGQLSGLEFAERIRIKDDTRPLWKYAAIPALVAGGLLLVWPSLFVQGTERIFHYRRAYAKPMPFRFVLADKSKGLQTFKNEDFKLEVEVEGDALPNEVTVLYDGRERRLTKVAPGRFSFTFQQPQRSTAFQLAAAGFTSEDYQLRVLERPNLRDFTVRAEYPAYLRRAAENLSNDGNLTVPEGTRLTWQFNTAATEQVKLEFRDPNETVAAQAADDDRFTVTRQVLRSQPYRVDLRNAISPNRDPIEYQLTVVPDQAPSITLEAFADTATRRYLALAGTLRDDYGLSRLALHYRVGTAQRPGAWRSAPIALAHNGPAQTYTHQWDLASLRLKAGDQLEYAVEVWDNDGLHGPKSARTRPITYRLPSRAQMREQLNADAQSMQTRMTSAQEQSKKLQRELAKAQEKLKTKRELSYSDRKEMQQMLEQKQQMDQQLEQMKRMFDQLQQKQEQMDPRSQQLAEKAKELQKLMDSMMDEKTKKLYEELQKLLQQQKAPESEIQKLLEKLENKEETLEKELERAMDLFKQLQLEQKMESTTEQLEKLAEQEQKLAEQTEKAAEKPAEQRRQENEQLKQQQQDAQKAFEEVKKELQELQKMDQQLDNQNNLDPMQQQQQETDQQMQESQEQLGKNQNQKASQNQKEAAQNMKEMAQKMRQQMEEEESDQQQENIDHLRDILENLLKLSFDQEGLMKQFRQVDQSDPRFLQLSQNQRKLRDDAVVIQDSLYALAKRVFQLQSFVTREVGEMNGQMDQAMQQLLQRNVPRATGSQQLAMTSMNNLALMLNDALQQMQEQQRQAQQNKSGSGKPGGKKKKGQQQSPGMGQMGKLQQQLNQQIQQLQQSGKQGRQLSEELAKMAAQQQMLREALQQLEKMQQQAKEGKNGKEKGEQGMGGLGELKKMMEQTEQDLVNKRLTEQTVLRQRQILSRLLEAEKSARERDLDNKREAETAKTVPPGFPPAFEKYREQRNRQTELLRTVPPALTPYYQREVSEYFQKMK